ncbi:sodium:solute symporter family protein [Patulibacter sp. SYSU D01012]|uniref:sodium:solute symporter family protein n=1 Tax=Patulibacter sp. SYSU D01012 TaxID=2817381 RepID=UPI001B31390B|nr:sodium:solute symporter family protein [Patulibacter sp. SYSU D01012]
MNMVLGYGGVALLFLVIVVVLERHRRTETSFSEYATAGRSFGPWYSMMAFVNTWYPGTIFISFAGLAAASGVIGFYFVPYSLLAVVLMYFLARPVHVWGKEHDLRTQADFLGLRYDSTVVRVVAALIGIVASFPWLVLGMQSLTLVFTYLSFGRVEATDAVYIGIAVIVVRQIWTIRMGARGIVIGDMVQGIVAYLLGTLLVVGLLTWLLTNGHGFGAPGDAFFEIPGPGSATGGLYYLSLVMTGALGGWCWPDIFVRLFASRGPETIKQAAVRAAPLMFIFGTAVALMAIAASTLPGVAEAPDAVFFLTADAVGPFAVTLAGMCVVAATMGNVGANLQALGAQTANDVVGVLRRRRVESPRVGQLAVGALLLVSAVFAVSTAKTTSNLVELAMISYAGIVQLAPTLFLGVFWRRGNAVAATASMIAGFATAAVLQWQYPDAVPGLEGLSGGMVGLIVNAAVYVACALLVPTREEERRRVDELFAAVREPRRASVPVSTLPDLEPAA